jgi:hypothetical protein
MISKLTRLATTTLSSLVLLILTLMTTATLWAQPALPAASCSITSLTGNYGFVVNGTSGGSPITTVGQISTNGNGTIAGFETTSLNGSITANVALLGTYQIKSDCTGTATITPAGGSPLNFSLAIIAGGKQIQLVETDNGTTASGNAYAQGVTTCSTAGVKGIYGLQGGGTEIGSGPLVYGGQITLLAGGTLKGSETGSVNGTIFTGAKISGAFKINKQCLGGAVISVGHGSPIHLNLVVVNGEKGVLFIRADANTLSSGFLQQ